LTKNIRPMAWSPVGGGALFSKSPNEAAKRIIKAGEALLY